MLILIPGSLALYAPGNETSGPGVPFPPLVTLIWAQDCGEGLGFGRSEVGTGFGTYDVELGTAGAGCAMRSDVLHPEEVFS